MNEELQEALTKFLSVVTEILIAKKEVKLPKKGPKGKPKPVEDEEEEENDDDSEDTSKRVEKSDEEETESDDEEETDENSEGPTREDVIDAIKAYVGKNKKGEREKAVALLKKKFGTGNVQKLEEEHFEAAIKLFSK